MTMPKTIEIELDEDSFIRAEAYAARRRQSVSALVAAYLRSVGTDLIEAALPDGACRPYLVMARQGGRDTTASFLARGGWDEFERPMPALFYGWARQSPGLIVDGGANTGYYALLAVNASADNRVLAFEPDPSVRKLLQGNVAANAFDERIDIRPAALSDRDGAGALFVPSQDHGVIETSSSLEPRFKGRHHGVLEIETVTLDAALETHAEPVRIIKLDLAGHEAAALAGAEATVARHRPVVFIEALERAEFGALSFFVTRHNYLDVPMRAQGALAAQGSVVFDPQAWNHALVPAEALPRFLALARAEA